MIPVASTGMLGQGRPNLQHSRYPISTVQVNNNPFQSSVAAQKQSLSPSFDSSSGSSTVRGNADTRKNLHTNRLSSGASSLSRSNSDSSTFSKVRTAQHAHSNSVPHLVAVRSGSGGAIQDSGNRDRSASVSSRGGAAKSNTGSTATGGNFHATSINHRPSQNVSRHHKSHSQQHSAKVQYSSDKGKTRTTGHHSKQLPETPATAGHSSASISQSGLLGYPKKQRAMLSLAVKRANAAVLLDQHNNVEGAMEAYVDVCNLLQQAIARRALESDRNQLQSIVSSILRLRIFHFFCERVHADPCGLFYSSSARYLGLDIRGG